MCERTRERKREASLAPRCLAVCQRLSSPELRSASSSPHCVMDHASRVCLAELIKTVNRSAHLKGEKERAGARKVK